MKILITGTAGFIGYHLVEKLAGQGHEITGIDSINDYYDTGLKYARLENAGIDSGTADYGNAVKSTKFPGYSFVRMNLEDREGLLRIFEQEKFDRVCNLAAQAGVRYSLENPFAYIDSNISGFMNILEGCRRQGVGHCVFASSSSVYGMNRKMPFSTSDNVDHPVSLYAATKKSNELMAHAYSHLYGIPLTGLRFFTVYGPWGRPDMAYYKFSRAIVDGRPIDVYNRGDMMRDFTYIDDIVDGIGRIIDLVPSGNSSWSGEKPDPASSTAPYRVYNLGNNNPVSLMDFIRVIEKALGKEAVKNMLPMQPGDVQATCADIDDIVMEAGYNPSTTVEQGIPKFVEWFREYHGV